MTFAECLEYRLVEPVRSVIEHDPVAERSIMGGAFKAVNPSRPVSPVNSKLLAGPFPRKRKSQVIGR